MISQHLASAQIAALQNNNCPDRSLCSSKYRDGTQNGAKILRAVHSNDYGCYHSPLYMGNASKAWNIKKA